MNPRPAHRRALTAVSRITFTLGLAGCIQPVEAPDPSPRDGDEPDGEVWLDADQALPDAGIEVDAEAHPDAGLEDPDDLGADDAEADAFVDAEAPDATPVACDPAEPDWAECCEEINWDPDQGCLAWGPPVPPRMPGEVAR